MFVWMALVTLAEFTNISECAANANVAVVFVNYTPSPEAKYPVALEQAMLQQNGLHKMAKSFFIQLLMLVSKHHLTCNIKKDIGSHVRL